MSETTPDMSNGGIATVMVGHTGHVHEYIGNAQVRFIKTRDVPGEQLEDHVPVNTKVVILTEGLPDYHYQWIMAFARRKSIPWLVRRTNQAVLDTLNSLFPKKTEKPTLADVIETQKHGRLKELIAQVDFNRSNADEARRLLGIAVEKGIKTTHGSLAQAIAQARRKTGRTAVPTSVRSQLDVSVELLEEMIKNLGDMRDFIIATTEENRLLRTRVAKIEAAFK